MPDRLAPQCNGQMRLAGPGRSQEQRRIATRYPPARRQFPNLARIERKLRVELEAGKFAQVDTTERSWTIEARALRWESKRGHHHRIGDRPYVCEALMEFDLNTAASLTIKGYARATPK